MADFSVIIPAFNDGGCIRDAIESVLSQGFLRQVIVVDDGSSDDTADVVKAIKDNRVLLLRKENEGPALARNAGAREATASHLVFLDADDVLLTGALSAFAHQHDRGDLLVRGVAVVRRGRDVRSNPSVASKFPYPRGSPLAGSFSVERRLFDELGGYDGEFRYGEIPSCFFVSLYGLKPLDVRMGLSVTRLFHVLSGRGAKGSLRRCKVESRRTYDRQTRP